MLVNTAPGSKCNSSWENATLLLYYWCKRIGRADVRNLPKFLSRELCMCKAYQPFNASNTERLCSTRHAYFVQYNLDFSTHSRRKLVQIVKGLDS